MGDGGRTALKGLSVFPRVLAPEGIRKARSRATRSASGTEAIAPNFAKAAPTRASCKRQLKLKKLLVMLPDLMKDIVVGEIMEIMHPMEDTTAPKKLLVMLRDLMKDIVVGEIIE